MTTTQRKSFAVRLAAPHAAVQTAEFPTRAQAEAYALKGFDAALAELTWRARKGVNVGNVPVLAILQDGEVEDELYLD